MPQLNVIDHPHNRQVVAALRAVYYVFAKSWGRDRDAVPTFSTEFDLGELRTHPDLGSALNMAAIGLPHTAGLILGYQVMVNSAGIIFALAMSMGFLAVRLPVTGPKNTVNPILGGPDIDLGADWVTANPWNREALHQRLAASLAYVNGLDKETAA